MSILGSHSCWVGNSDSAEEKGAPAVFDSSPSHVAKVAITLQFTLTIKKNKLASVLHGLDYQWAGKGPQLRDGCYLGEFRHTMFFVSDAN